MDLNELVQSCAEWLRMHLYEITLSWVAATLVIYGRELFTLLRDLIKKWHILLRVLVFILFCAFGYGWLTFQIAQFIEAQLAHAADLNLVVFTLVGFIVIGVLAERKKQI